MQARKPMALGMLCALFAQSARAAPDQPDIGTELQLIDSTERDLDPLGIDSNVGAGLDEAAARLKPAVKPPPPVRVGAVLSAIEPVFEREYAVSARWDSGLMHVDTRIVLASKSALPAAAAYRLPLPEDAVLSRVAVCSGSLCSVASAEGATRTPAAGQRDLAGVTAAIIRDLRGRALSLRAFPVRAGHDVRVEISYLASAEVHGGVAEFVLPARGEDPRLVAPTLLLSAPNYVDFSESGLTAGTSSAYDDRNQARVLRGTVRENAPKTASFGLASCGQGSCTRSYALRPFRAAAARTTWLWLDASPSMEGRARNRADRVLATLLGILPDDTQLRAAAFAAKTRDLGRFRADAVKLSVLSDALLDDLGNTSRVHGLVSAALPDIAREAPRILVLSDGKLDPSDHGFEALTMAATHGADVWLLHVGDDAISAPARVHVLSFGGADTLHDERLADTLRTLVAARDHGSIAGEGMASMRVPRSLPAPHAGAPDLWVWAARHIVRDAYGAPGALIDTTRAAMISAPPYASVAPPDAPALTGLPKESVLSMLRTQLVPRARACLRSDRRGRADYAVGLTFEAEFAAREIYDTRVTGDVPRALSACLLAILPELQIPAFTGRVRVRYPIHTERELVPTAVVLPAHVIESVARALGTEVRKAR